MQHSGSPLPFYASFSAKARICTCTSRAVDTITPAGKAILEMLGALAAFEFALIVGHVRAGLARAR